MDQIIKSKITAIKFAFVCILILGSTSACAQDKTPSQESARQIGNCEGCEAVFEYGEEDLQPVDTLPDFNEEGPRIEVSGMVYEPDGSTPAEGVILYVYHTNREGIYENKFDRSNYERKHGYIRGWVKTGADGKYAFYTLRPGAYPSGSIPAHIHITVLEPNGKYYWLGSYHFADDPMLSDRERNPKRPRGGSSGLLDPHEENGILKGSRDIVLGENVPGY